jgi:hypothetical protein
MMMRIGVMLDDGVCNDVRSWRDDARSGSWRDDARSDDGATMRVNSPPRRYNLTQSAFADFNCERIDSDAGEQQTRRPWKGRSFGNAGVQPLVSAKADSVPL